MTLARSPRASNARARALRPLPFVVASERGDPARVEKFLPSSSARLRIDRFDHLGSSLEMSSIIFSSSASGSSSSLFAITASS